MLKHNIVNQVDSNIKQKLKKQTKKPFSKDFLPKTHWGDPAHGLKLAEPCSKNTPLIYKKLFAQ